MGTDQAAGGDLCETAVQGQGIDQDCFGHVTWAMNTGINDHPEWYPNMTPTSTFEAFQCELYGMLHNEHCTIAPCGFDCPRNTEERCHDLIDGDEHECMEHVTWAMTTGINTHPEWYLGLTANSPQEEFHCRLALSPNVVECTAMPCSWNCDGTFAYSTHLN